MNLYTVMTIREAAERWDLNYETLRQALKRGKFDEQKRIGTIRKSSGVWLFTEEAMTAVFGEKVPKERI